jgi:hypothetical protein
VVWRIPNFSLCSFLVRGIGICKLGTNHRPDRNFFARVPSATGGCPVERLRFIFQKEGQRRQDGPRRLREGRGFGLRRAARVDAPANGRAVLPSLAPPPFANAVISITSTVARPWQIVWAFVAEEVGDDFLD